MQAGAQESATSFAVGVYVGLGFGTVEQAQIGVFAEYNARRWSPGVDIRLNGSGGSGFRGTLAGPRASWKFGKAHVYGEALAGPNYQTAYDDKTYQPYKLPGVASELVFGTELEENAHVRWRVLEYTHGWFLGASNAQQTIVSTGIVFRLP